MLARYVGWGTAIAFGLYVLWNLRPFFLDPVFNTDWRFLLLVPFLVVLAGWSIGRRFYGVLSGKESLAQATINPQLADPSHRFSKLTSAILLAVLIVCAAVAGYFVVSGSSGLW